MSTIKQKLALQKTLENGGNITQAMRDAGYKETTINNPSNLTKSQAFQDMCEESGLTDTLLLSALIEDIKDKKGNKKAELELGFKIKGRLIQKTDITSADNQIFINQPLTEEEKQKLLSLIV